MKGLKGTPASDGERFGRAKKPAAPELLELQRDSAHPTPLDVSSYHCQALIHRAHVVMLTEEGILTKDEGSRMLKGIRRVEEEAEADESLTSYMSTETSLIERIGEVGGKMHIGRSRNDLAQTQRRMFYRDQIGRLIEVVIGFKKALLDKAEENLETVMPGYTHWRQAQPVTLAHYLVAHADAAGRTLERLGEAYNRTNLSTLGAAALAGTGWPIDRKRTMGLLGFDGLCENSYDCVAAHDYVIELASAITIHMSNLSRLAEDIQIWSSDEFQMIDLDEAYAGTSSIMPQKKNPSALELVKSHAAESIGALVSALSSVKGTAYANIQDRVALEPVTIEIAIGSTRVMSGVVSTLIPMKERMLLSASRGFSTMTELADTLVRSHGLAFRQAHDIIAETTREAVSKGMTADQITTEMIEGASLKVLGRAIGMSRDSLRSAMDPLENVRRRNVIGGPAPEEVGRMIEDRRRRIEAEEARHGERLMRLEKAREELGRAEARITG